MENVATSKPHFTSINKGSIVVGNKYPHTRVVYQQWRTQGEEWGSGSPLYQNMILKVCPKTLENFSRRGVYPHL